MKKILVTVLALSALSAQAATVTFYGDKFHGKKTASGERFNQNAMTCASNSHKFGTRLKVTNTANDKSVICRVNDRGGFSKYGVTLDLSKGAFAKIAPLAQGRARVIIEKVSDSIAQDTQGNKSSTLAQDNLSAKKVAEMLSQVEKVSTSHTIRITLASNTPVTE
ncbi:Rare lipoprotein A precursor [Moraxella catarrhalis]|uniref:Rare lipoprotein A n=1 Tax=Moraxella catarrhalis TaxID=480 RepID=A0AB36DQH9_MORCA|nr:septal ring lytic transglycosylase RlpA family protein [Moraxella catarrhalis]MPX29180.1 septal ring lytic transglycosylase RlpA family protein [Moraxella catarrhalis]OAV04918.1 Rare lipoprotein A precursor [Moraxella catarrhalis]OAV18804.1 Rare lipoprotein A precursor [Moraxella catarrhalis]OAV22456.1 Rare lipoprotein A precursor [Moraxella catarrhalis]OAV27056.1 Rare lipoprotein A precursor [Moraxella catarrhalis]